MIEIYLLEQLHAFHKCGTLSGVAEELNITQPSVSRGMQKLEALLGVSLFDRSKNSIKLNKTGKLAAEYAARILDVETEMERAVKAFDRSQHQINIGSIAPGPLMVLLSQTASLFSEMTISSNLEKEENLISGLYSSQYDVIILTHPLHDEKYDSRKYITEKLFVSLNRLHPAAAQKSVSFADMDGQSFIMFSQVGIWEQIVSEKMQHSKFYKQENLENVSELAKISELPTFSTDIALRVVSSGNHSDRINIPFSDDQAVLDFYITYQNKNEFRKYFDSF